MEKSKPVRRNSQTAYLDGLRGFAALLVYSLHHQMWGHEGFAGQFMLENAFGFDGKYYFSCLPGIRIFFSGGHLAVAVFFVISGYVLSRKPLTLIHARDTDLLADNLTSALFRRWLRLFLPVLATTFVWMTSWHLFGIRSSQREYDAPESTYASELWKWYCDFKNYSFIFNSTVFNHYNDHAWSLPMEFRGSIVVWTTLLALARCGSEIRLAVEAGLIWYFLYIVDGWYCGLFIMGVLICDYDLLSAADRLPAALRRREPLPTWVFYLLFIAALYLGGVPSVTDDLARLRESPGWYYLSFLKPQAFYDFRWFYRFWAATLLMISIPRLGWLKAFFETPFNQYLGRISFSLYLVHGPVLWSIGDRVYAATGRSRETHVVMIPDWIDLFPFPNRGPLGLEFNYLVAHLILLPLTLALAEASTKLFDEASLRVSQWLYHRCIETDRHDSVWKPAQGKQLTI